MENIVNCVPCDGISLSLFSLKQCIINNIIKFGFVVSGIINVLVGVITLSIQPWLITLTSPLVIADITKISSNICLQIENMIVTRICLWHSPVKIVNLGSLIRIMAWSADHCTHIHRVPIEHTIILHRHKLRSR